MNVGTFTSLVLACNTELCCSDVVCTVFVTLGAWIICLSIQVDTFNGHHRRPLAVAISAIRQHSTVDSCTSFARHEVDIKLWVHV